MIHGQLQDATREALDNNLKEEVRLTLLNNDDTTYANWITSVNAGEDLESDDTLFAAIVVVSTWVGRNFPAAASTTLYLGMSSSLVLLLTSQF